MSKDSRGFFRRILEGFKDSLIDEKLEAELYLASDKNLSKKRGEVEFYRHTQGHFSMKIKMDLNLFEGESEVKLIVGRKHSLTLSVEPGKETQFKLNSKWGDSVPEIQSNETVDVECKGEVFLKGVFEKD